MNRAFDVSFCCLLLVDRFRLNKECPVLLLTWNSPIADLSTHWVTVTRIYNNGSATKIVTSNWAEKQIYDFSTWVNGSSIYKGVIYFE